jgi:hypothetical protein
VSAYRRGACRRRQRGKFGRSGGSLGRVRLRPNRASSLASPYKGQPHIFSLEIFHVALLSRELCPASVGAGTHCASFRSVTSSWPA